MLPGIQKMWFVGILGICVDDGSRGSRIEHGLCHGSPLGLNSVPVTSLMTLSIFENSVRCVERFPHLESGHINQYLSHRAVEINKQTYTVFTKFPDTRLYVISGC